MALSLRSEAQAIVEEENNVPADETSDDQKWSPSKRTKLISLNKKKKPLIVNSDDDFEQVQNSSTLIKSNKKKKLPDCKLSDFDHSTLLIREPKTGIAVCSG